MGDPQFQKHGGKVGEPLPIHILVFVLGELQLKNLSVSPSWGNGRGGDQVGPCGQSIHSSSTMPYFLLEALIYLNRDIHPRLGDVHCFA